MSNIHVLGTTGFIGQSLRHSPHSHEYTFWSSQQTSALNYFDLFNEDSWQYLISQKPESVIFLSWPGLPNYNSQHHLSTILPQYMKLVHRLLDAGLIKLLHSLVHVLSMACKMVNFLKLMKHILPLHTD